MTMFSSNPFPELPSSPNVIFPPNFMFDRERDTDCFNYHMNNSDPFITSDCFQASYNSFSAPSSATIGNTTTIKQDFCSKEHMFIEEPELQNSEDHDDDDLLDSIISSCKKKTVPVVSRKDGHSKIYTARGPRDRRVRLSIDISRKFFCLQDLLGFDKASKTLDWLFGKCKTAIKELVEETNRCPSSTTTYQSKTSFLEAIMGGRDMGKSKKRLGLKFVDGNRKKITQKLPVGVQENLARDQSRAVARARARERVREKMRIKELDDELKTLVHDDFHYQKFKSGVRENQRVISAYPTAGEYH